MCLTAFGLLNESSIGMNCFSYTVKYSGLQTHE